MKKGLIITLSIVIVVILALGYFGLVPGVSTALGANKPKDLGVRFTDKDLASARSKTAVELKDQSEGKSLSFEGSKSISADYSSEEITAMISSAKYKYYPLKNTQVKINSDGTVEASGNLNIAKAGQWSLDLGADEGLVSKAKSYIGVVSPSPSFYLKGKMSVQNNQISLDIAEAKVSRFAATKNIISQYQGQLAGFVEDRISNVPGMNVRSAKFENSNLKLDADYPAVEKSLK